VKTGFSYLGAAEARPKGRSGSRLRIGVVKGTTEKAQPEVRARFEESIAVLRTFADVETGVEFPDLPFGPAVSTIVSAEGASAFRDLIESGRCKELRAANDTWGGYAASMTFAVDYIAALRLRAPMKKAMDRLYARYDALVAPSRASVAYPIGMDFDKAYPGVSGGPGLIPAGNLVGHPAISVPNGFGAEGLPTGLQIVGPAFSENRLLFIARTYQSLTDWGSKRPPGHERHRPGEA
jgi:aspartyl-tRNA(Asn)/glutamyl-tRNA(Gln) amidotransferase subunit A